MKTIVTIILLSVASFVTAQETKIWATINDISKLEKDSAYLALNLNTTKAFPASRNANLQKVYEFSTNNINEVTLINILSKFSEVSGIEIAPTYQSLGDPNDYNTNMYDYALNLINAPGAWNITTGDSTIAIGISDTNFDLTHEELINKSLYVSPNIYGTDYNHGTAVAAIAAGNTDNGVGSSSIGYNTHMKFFGMSYNELLTATYNGCRVINASWASGCTYNQYGQMVIDEVYANGSIVVAAAGNGSTCGGSSNLVYPAAFDHVISVTSVGASDNHERFLGNSNLTHQHNSQVDICAPGYDVIAPVGNSYVTVNGTSFAAPYVSGTIALMLAVNPCLTFEAVENILDTTAVDIYPFNSAYIGLLGAGRLDAHNAVRLAELWVMNVHVTAENVTCFGMNNGSVAAVVTGGNAPYTYEWNTGTTTPLIQNATAGLYEVSVIDANGCMRVASAEVTEPPVLEAAVKGINGWIDLAIAGGTPGYEIEWNNGATTEDLYNIETGFYEVLVTDATGCMVSANIEFEAEISSVNELNQRVSIYPNPAQNIVNISGIDVNAIELMDITGRTYKVTVIDNQFNVNEIPAGTYTFTTGNNLVEKIIVL
jgi:hypothetical protein